MEGLKKELKNIQKALLTGTSYMMPLVVAGGILFSFSLLGGDATSTGIVVANSFMANLKIIGAAGLFMMIPVSVSYTHLDVYKRQSIYTSVIRGQYGVAAALSTVLTVLTVISLLVFNKFSGGKSVQL